MTSNNNNESSTSKTLAEASLPTTVIVRQNNSDPPSTTTPTTTTAEATSSNMITIILDPAEEQLFGLIVGAAEAFAKGDIDLPPEEWQGQEERPSHVVVRVAGGWVRDKVLLLASTATTNQKEQNNNTGAEIAPAVVDYDVDLAVEHMTGVQLAKLIMAYVQQYHPDLLAKGGKGNSSSSSVGVIAANPEQSKHLETATFKLCGIEMDVSNLRAHEVYTADSRIPMVRQGTPLEDSLRRDFTVNALYYNLHSKQVEDWTGRGVPDLLQEQVLVTPLEPVQTFRDDPLRILRAVRFAVRLQLTMDANMKEAARLPEIRQALRSKVSRERFGKELNGMLKGKQARPLVALQTIIELGLAPIVFELPHAGVEKVGGVQGTLMGAAYTNDDNDNNEGGEQVQRAWQESLQLLPVTARCSEFFESIIKEKQQQDQQQQTHHLPDARLLPLAVILAPLRHLTYFETKKPDRFHSAVGYIIRESIKFKKDDVNALALLAEQVDAMVNLLEKSSLQHGHEDTTGVTRLEAGMLLRSLKEYWPTALLLAAILMAHRHGQDHQDGIALSQSATERLYRKIVDEYQLDQCWKNKPLLDGKVLQKSFGKGPIVGVYMQEQIRWMLSHPQGTAEDCLAHLKQYEPGDPMDTDGPTPKKQNIGS